MNTSELRPANLLKKTIYMLINDHLIMKTYNKAVVFRTHCLIRFQLLLIFIASL